MKTAVSGMVIALLLALFGVDRTFAQTPAVVEVKPLVTAPGEAGKWEGWREGLRAERLGYDGGAYRREAFAWVPSCYCCCFAMMYDQKLYDPVKRCYTADTFLDEGVREFGGYDAVVLWQAYPRIGFDDRDQFDFYRDMPPDVLATLHLLC